MKVLLVASAGGHLAHLWWLKPWWERHERVWVSDPLPDVRGLLRDERVFYAHWPTNRRVDQVVLNAIVAHRVYREIMPDLVVSTGAGLAIPFLALAPFYGVRSLFIEVYDRVDRPSLTGRLLRDWVDEVVLQWPEQRVHYPHGHVLGAIR